MLVCLPRRALSGGLPTGPAHLGIAAPQHPRVHRIVMPGAIDFLLTAMQDEVRVSNGMPLMSDKRCREMG